MRFDEYGLVVMEHSSPEGNLGDSCAETCRFFLTLHWLRVQFEVYPIGAFRTADGYVRHPLSIWREDDFSSDQALPLFLIMRERFGLGWIEFIGRIRKAGYKTGNGDFVSPGLFAEMKNSQFLRVLFLLIQMLIFKFPFRWNDEKKWFERTSQSSADYLNFIFVCLYAPKWVRKLVNKETLKAKVAAYYKPEPNAFVVENYNALIERYF